MPLLPLVPAPEPDAPEVLLPPPLLEPDPPVAPVLDPEVSLLPPEAPVLLAPAPEPLVLVLSEGRHPPRTRAEIAKAAAADRMSRWVFMMIYFWIGRTDRPRCATVSMRAVLEFH